MKIKLFKNYLLKNKKACKIQMFTSVSRLRFVQINHKVPRSAHTKKLNRKNCEYLFKEHFKLY